MLTIPQPFGGLVIPRSRVSVPVLTYIGRATSTTESTTITISDVSIGTASADRLVVVSAMCVHNDNGNLTVITGGSIGGSAATLVVASNGMDYPALTAILSRVVTSGTTATITINLSVAVQRTALDVYTIKGLNSTTAHHTNTTWSTNNTSFLGTTLNIPANGFAIGGLAAQDEFNVYSHTWSGLTEDADSASGLSYGGYTSASGQMMSAESGRSISVTANGNSRRKSMCVASWA
ncbi:hypothetical protein [Aquamicrobium sp.]|uniref:hypothetical protein n=1 Tax=Aquamicrobium sp. TaxID=1872579 RepID=UPI00258EC180|nr:hypothetical protein [Aquamicrobium sp.]MCK9549212.1 hypothetical protein [Aquamicrobium sp.]